MSTTFRPVHGACVATFLLCLTFAQLAGAQTGTLSETDKTLYAISTAHLDTQWRWTIQDTITRFIPNTMQTNFAHFERSPDYVFSFEGAFRYMLMKEYYPEEYERLKQYVAQDRWRLAGSSVDAGDSNVPSPESLIRHVLYGNGFFREEFGKTSRDIFLPDCFGFGYALPTVAAHCGLKGFSTQKLGWGSAVDVPFDIGVWEGVDGQSIVAALRPGGYTAQIRNDLSKDEGWLKRIDALGKQSKVYAGYKYFGVGDTGGGPDEETISWLDKATQGDGPVKVVSTGSDQLFRDLTPEQIAALPRYKGELVMSVHGTGCYTSQAAMKRWNRKNELLADAAERAAVMADWVGSAAYPRDKLQEAWVRFLWHQFHDDLTGTSIPEAYEFSWNDEIISLNQFAQVLLNSVGAASKAMDTRTKGSPVIVMNPLSIDREDIVEAMVAPLGDAQPTVARAFGGDIGKASTEPLGDTRPAAARVFGPDGGEVPSQLIEATSNGWKIAFLAKVPSVGFAVYDVRAAETPYENDLGVRASETSLENQRYRVSLDDNGDVSSVFDKAAGRELLSAPARLELLKDQSPQWPAWEIIYRDVMRDPAAYAEKPVKVEVLESGPVRAAVRLTRYAGGSTVVQTLRLAAGEAGNRLDFATKVGWRTKGMMMKASFPLAASNPEATYDLGIGTINRPNNTPRKYEVPAQQWADITNTDGSFGAAVLTDSRYGWDKPADNILRLTLLHTPKPGSFSDQATQDLGKHEFTYSLAGHGGNWADGGVVWEAARLNQPLIAFCAGPHEGALGKSVSLASTSDSSVAIRALKKAEDSDDVVVRLQETAGESAKGVNVSLAGAITAARELNGAEEALANATVRDGKLLVDMKPYQPRTFAVTMAKPKASIAKPECLPVTLTFNRDVVSSDANRADGDFDSEGHTLPAALLPETVVSEGIPFKIGPTADGELNAVACQGQTVTFEPGYEKLYVLAASVGRDRQARFYSGLGLTTVFPIQEFTGMVGRWDSRRVEGRTVNNYQQLAPSVIKRQPIAWVGTHRHHRERGNEPYVFCYLFRGYPIHLHSRQTSITLPDDPNIIIMAATLVRNASDVVVPGAPLYDQPVQIEDLPPISTTLPPRPPDQVGVLTSGLDYSYYEGRFNSVSDLEDAKPARTGKAASFGILPDCRGEDFALKFEGFIRIEKDGLYTFYTTSDDGSMLYVGNVDVVDNDGLHSRGESCGEIALKAGMHKITVMYFQGPVDKSLDVSYEGPGIEKLIVPGSVLFREG